MKESFRRSVGFATVANVVYAGMQWGLISILAKGGSLTLLGQYAYSMAIIAPAITFLGLNLRAVQVVDFTNQFPFQDYWGLRLLTTAMGCGVFLLIGLWVFDSTAARMSFAAIGLFRCAESVMDLTHGYFQKSNRMRLVCRSMCIRAFLGLAAFAAIVLVWQNLAAAFIALGVVVVCTVLWHDIPLIRRSETIQLGTLQREMQLALKCLPLTIGLLLSSLQANGPRIILKHYAGVESVGVFAALSYFVVIGGTLVSAVAGVASPRIAEWFAEGAAAKIERLTRQMLLLDVLIGLGLLAIFGLFSHLIFRLLLSADIARFANLGVWIALTAVLSFMESHLGVVVTAMNVLKQQVPIQTIRMLSALVAALILIPVYGILGAVWAIIFSLALSCLMFYALYQRHLRQCLLPAEMHLAGFRAEQPDLLKPGGHRGI